MPIYDAIIHAMSTAGTGGFGMLNSSMAGYAPVCQWIVAFFMVLFAINFNLFFLIIMGQWRTARVVRFENKKVDEAVISSCNTYFTLYIVCIAVIFLLICWEPFGLTTNLSAAITCFNNVGPGFGIISPSGNYSAFSPFSKLVLSGAMLLGRLEIYPMPVAITPTAWAKRR